MTEKITRRWVLSVMSGAIGLGGLTELLGGGESEEPTPSSDWLTLHTDDAVAAHEFNLPNGQPRSDAETASSGEMGVDDTDTPLSSEEVAHRVERQIMEGTQYETTVHDVKAPIAGPTTMVIGGIHGDEAAGHRAAARIADWGIDAGRLVVVPAANVPALSDGTRRGPHGDMNRQFPATRTRSPTSPPARALWSLIREISPDRLLDLHSSNGIYRPGDRAGDGVGQAIFPTIVPPAPAYARRVAQAVNLHFGLSGSLAYRRGNLLDGDRPMLAHRAGVVLDIPAFILETYRRPRLSRQVDWHTFAVATFMRQTGQPPRVEER